MGADIYFNDGSYFRDSYNEWNLAWAIGVSYWGEWNKDPTKFMKRLSEITDEEIEEYCMKKVEEDAKEKKKEMKNNDSGYVELRKELREKRDELKKIFAKNHKVKVSKRLSSV